MPCPTVLIDQKPLQALAEGMTVGAYTYGDFKSEHKPNKLENVHLIGPGRPGGNRGARARVVGWPKRCASFATW